MRAHLRVPRDEQIDAVEEQETARPRDELAMGLYGNIHLHSVPGPSAESQGRQIRVWTPREYSHTTSHRFPVLYLQDGQNVFSDPRSKSLDLQWRADRTAQKLVSARSIEPLILVGVDHDGARRADDYTAVAWKGKGGQADDFADRLVNNIKPFVDRLYRTRPGAKSTALGGSSLGGLFALHAGLKMSHVFGGIMAMSPSVFWGDDHILMEVEQALNDGVRIWLDIGRHETITMRNGYRKLLSALIRNGWREGRAAHHATLRASEDPDGRHDEASWGRRFEHALKFLFPAKQSAHVKIRRGTS